MLAFLVGRSFAFGSSDATAHELLKNCVETINSVQAVYYKAEYGTPEAPLAEIIDHPVLERNTQGAILGLYLERWWDARNLNRCKCRQLQLSTTKVPRYSEYEYTVDGEFFRTYGITGNVAVIRRLQKPLLPFSCLSLLGYGFMGSPDHISQLLLKSGRFDEQVIKHDHGIVEIQGRYQPTDGEYERRVSIFLKPQESYLPQRYLLTFDRTNTADADIRVTETASIDGVLFPVRGSVHEWSIKLHLPDGLTSGEVNAMPKKKAHEVMTRAKFEAIPFESAPNITVDRATLKINEIHPREFFHLELPEHAEFRDFSGPEPVLRPAPNAAIPISTGQRSRTILPTTANNHSMLIYMLLAVNAAILVLFQSRRLRKYA